MRPVRGRECAEASTDLTMLFLKIRVGRDCTMGCMYVGEGEGGGDRETIGNVSSQEKK